MRTAASRTFWWLWSMAAAVALPSQQPATVVIEVQVEREQVWIEQAVQVTVRLALDHQFFAERAVPMVQHRVDLPIHLVLPWLETTDAQEAYLLDREGPRLALGDQVARCVAKGTEERSGRPFDVYEIHCVWTGRIARQHVLPPAVLTYAYASTFEETLLGGRQPVDRAQATVVTDELRLAVRELPDVGKPDDFSGAVGEFTISGVAATSEVEVGDSLTIIMTVQGVGNLDRFTAPPWPRWPGLAVQGLVEHRQGQSRSFSFDTLVLAEDAPSPVVSFAFFALDESEYRTVSAEVELHVIPRAAGRPLSPRVAKLIAARAEAPSMALPWWLYLVAVALAVGGLLIVSQRKRR